MKLKSKDFFAADAGFEQALEILSGHPYRLFSYLSFRANRNTGRIEFRYKDVAEKLKRSEKSLGTDFKELRRQGICRMNTAVNQHSLVCVEICDQFWPYVKIQDTAHRIRLKPDVSDTNTPTNNGATAGGSLDSVVDNLVLDPERAASQTRADSEAALTELRRFGISPASAKRFIQQFDAGTILDKIEYVRSLVAIEGTRIRSRQSMLVYYLVEQVPIPEDFVSTKRQQAERESKRLEMNRLAHIETLKCEYDGWCKEQAEFEIKTRFLGQDLDRKLGEIASKMSKADPRFAQIPNVHQPKAAYQVLIRDIRAVLELLSFEDWCKAFAKELPR